jgi:metallo-beta-lactamase family protein
MVHLSFHGAAGEVTGSCYLLQTQQARVLVDFGMFQGGRDSEERNRAMPAIDAHALDAVVLSHAHLDHCGRLPLLTQCGYAGPIFSTPATFSLAQIILRDSASIQEADAERENRYRASQDRPIIEPLYTVRDTERVFALFQTVRYGERKTIAPGVDVRLFDAGHILGSASIEMRVRDTPDAREMVIVFSADVGVPGSPLLRDPTPPHEADVVVLESTYGDRDHRGRAATVEELVELLERSRAEDGKVLIPAFAVGRTQDLIYHFGEQLRAGRIKELSVHIDSPMAIEVSELYKRYPHLFDAETCRLRARGYDPLDFPGLQYAQTPQQSQKLNNVLGGTVIIAGAGMCTGGRILHHLRHSLANPATRVVFVGYQAEGTLGRRLVNGDKVVRVHGEEVPVRAVVHTVNGFSAHAGQSELVNWVRPVAPSKPRVFLTHGEQPQREKLAARLRAELGLACELPMHGHSVLLAPRSSPR